MVSVQKQDHMLRQKVLKSRRMLIIRMMQIKTSRTMVTQNVDDFESTGGSRRHLPLGRQSRCNQMVKLLMLVMKSLSLPLLMRKDFVQIPASRPRASELSTILLTTLIAHGAGIASVDAVPPDLTRADPRTAESSAREECPPSASTTAF